MLIATYAIDGSVSLILALWGSWCLIGWLIDSPPALTLRTWLADLIVRRRALRAGKPPCPFHAEVVIEVAAI